MKKRFGFVQFETPEGEKYQGIINKHNNFMYLAKDGDFACSGIKYLTDTGWKLTHDLRSEYWIGHEGYFSNYKNPDNGLLQKIGGYSVDGHHGLGVSWEYFTPINHKKVAIQSEIEQLKKRIKYLEAKL